VLLSWSHRGRFRSEAAFARLAGAAPDPRLLRTRPPPPPRPRRRPAAQPRPARGPHQPPQEPRADDQLHRAQDPRGQERARGNPLPQALPRPPPLPRARGRPNRDLTLIEASPKPVPRVKGVCLLGNVDALVRLDQAVCGLRARTG
jgi:hypothetical protein